jgi:hypothetical protein
LFSVRNLNSLPSASLRSEPVQRWYRDILQSECRQWSFETIGTSGHMSAAYTTWTIETSSGIVKQIIAIKFVNEALIGLRSLLGSCVLVAHCFDQTTPTTACISFLLLIRSLLTA